MDRFGRLHGAAVSNRWLGHFTVGVRLLLAIGFVPPGLTKVLGEPFTIIPPDNPIGLYFHVLHDTGAYYRMIGLVQVLAGMLLLFPRTALVGALLYLPVITNILVLTWALSFGGTWVITTLMFLANVYLLAWDYDKLRGLWRRREGDAPDPVLSTLGAALTVGGLGLAGFLALGLLGLSIFNTYGLRAGIVVTLAGAAAGAFARWHVARMG